MKTWLKRRQLEVIGKLQYAGLLLQADLPSVCQLPTWTNSSEDPMIYLSFSSEQATPRTRKIGGIEEDDRSRLN